MKRSDYNEFLYIRSAVRKYIKTGTRPTMWHILTSYSAELKQKADELIRSMNFFPCHVGECCFFRDGREFIIYIAYEDEKQWLELTTEEERAWIAEAINR